RPSDRTAPALVQLARPDVERALQLLERVPTADEEIRKGAAIGPHLALDLPLVAPRARPTRIELEATRPREGRERAIEHCRRPGPRGHRGLEIIQPDPERHAPVALKEREVPGLPG